MVASMPTEEAVTRLSLSKIKRAYSILNKANKNMAPLAEEE